MSDVEKSVFKISFYDVKLDFTQQITIKSHNIYILWHSPIINQFLNMVNEFLLGCRHRRGTSFCLQCRQQKVSDVLQQNLSTAQLEIQVLSDAEEYRRLNHVFEETLCKIIRTEAYRQKCLQNTHYTCFGWWLRSQPQYQNVSDQRKNHLKDQVRFAHTVYMKWETIVENLTDPEITRIDARKLSIEQLYQARREEWCIDYDEFLRGTGNIPEVLFYDENKYEGIIRHILRSGILEDVDYDRRQVSMLGRRLQKDLNKIRRLANP